MKKPKTYRSARRKLSDLEGAEKKYKAKLNNPQDPDDKKWTARRVRLIEQRIARKIKSIEAKEAASKQRDS
jgi:hypothetical protein